jgi:hypothetical protein
MIPIQLVTMVHAGDDQARKILDEWCRPSLAALIAAMSDGIVPAPVRADVLIERALRWLLMYLRGRDPASYKGIERVTFVRSLVSAAYRGLASSGPFEPVQSRVWPSEAAPDAYQLRTHLQPLEHVGGDWWCQDGGRGGPLWVMIADVTGHGYPAYLLASGLPHLWRMSRIAELRGKVSEPCELLGALGRELESILPDEVFIEAALGRFATSGEVRLSAAGGCRTILRRSGTCLAEFHDLGGFLLGMELGDREQRSWTLWPGDEFLLATDGLFDQPCGVEERLHASLPRCMKDRLSSGSDLHDAVTEVLREALCDFPQHDDITVITLRRSERLPSAGASDADL